jgi:2'-5' RNA ligase
MRLFVAVNLPDGERKALAAAGESLRDMALPVKWTDASGLHVTLKFLGEVEESQAGPIGSALSGVTASLRPFDVTLGGLGAFPSLERPRVVWVGVERHPALELLANDVERALGAFGFESELKPFHPHVTLGRVKREARPAALRPLAGAAAAFEYAGSMQVSAVDLMRSTLGPRGAAYAVVHRAQLGGG